MRIVLIAAALAAVAFPSNARAASPNDHPAVRGGHHSVTAYFYVSVRVVHSCEISPATISSTANGWRDLPRIGGGRCADSSPYRVIAPTAENEPVQVIF